MEGTAGKGQVLELLHAATHLSFLFSSSGCQTTAAYETSVFLLMLYVYGADLDCEQEWNMPAKPCLPYSNYMWQSHYHTPTFPSLACLPPPPHLPPPMHGKNLMSLISLGMVGGSSHEHGRSLFSQNLLKTL